MLALSEEGKKFFDSLTEGEQKRLVDKIKEVIQDFKNWIKTVLSKLRSEAPEAVLLRELAQDLDAISKKWDEMLRQAAKANAAMKKAGVNDKAIMESKASDTQNADIDTYTAAQYNNFGWVAVNKVLTGKELKKLYSQFAKIKLNKEQNVKNKLGEYLIPVGDKYGSIDKIVYIKGTNKHPIIRQVVEVNKPFLEEAERHIMEVMKYEATGLYFDAFEIHMAYAGQGIFSVHKAVSYPSYSELRKGTRGRDGEGTYGTGRERDAGTGVSKAHSGEVRGNDGEVSYSDIDTEYMEAVDKGDIVTAQKLVDDAAKNAGYSVKAWLEENNIKTYTGKSTWQTTSILAILQNEKYCGDVMYQKTYCVDCLTKKKKVNNDQKTKYLVVNDHPAIIPRDIFKAAMAEFARRNALRSKSDNALRSKSDNTIPAEEDTAQNMC